MKSVGEAMAIGRTFKESLQKCLRPLETRRPCARTRSGVSYERGKLSPCLRKILEGKARNLGDDAINARLKSYAGV